MSKDQRCNMGGDFFRNAVEGPLALFGRNSSVGKIVNNDPLMNAIGVQNGKGQQSAPVGSGYYAGKDPTLATAAAGYQPPAPTGYSAPAGTPQAQQPRVGGIMPTTVQPRVGQNQTWG